MRSPTAALVWDIWQRHRIVLLLIVAMTVAGRILGASSAMADSPVVDLLLMASFALLFGVFSYTESSDSRGLGRFPHRLFVLPVSSLRLVAGPMLAGVVAIELLYLAWGDPVPLTAVLLGTFLLCAQTAIWTLHRLGPFRLLVVGMLAIVAFWISLQPFDGLLALLIAGVGLVMFAGAWGYIAGVRSGGVGLTLPTGVPMVPALAPTRRRAFTSPTAAQFWFEWRSSGIVLPLLVGGILLAAIAPLSWSMRDDAGDTTRLLIGTLGAPIVLAMAVGMGFGKPTFWSQDLAMSPFVAVRPLDDDDLVAIKVKVAAASAAVSWILVVAFIGVWLTLWAPPDAVRGFATQPRALILLSGMFLTWRFLVSRMWSGLAGSRPLFFGSVALSGVAVLAAMALDAQRLPGWVLAESGRVNIVVLGASAAVIAKSGLAAFAWRHVQAAYRWQYLLVWLAGTATIGSLGLVLWGRESLVILFTLLTIPLARVGLAPSSLARNRHR